MKKNLLMFSGVLSIPLSILSIIIINNAFRNILKENLISFRSGSIITIGVFIGILIYHSFQYLFEGKRDFTPVNFRSPVYKSSEKRTSMRPKVDSFLLSTQPEGFVIGRQDSFLGRKLVRIPIDDTGKNQGNQNLLILGGPGSYKTVTILNLILGMKMTGRKASAFIIDRKPDLTIRSFDQSDNDSIRILRPTVSPESDPYTDPGWVIDPLYGLNEESPEYSVLERANLIGRSLVQMPEDGRNSYFYKNAATLMSGIILYGFYRGKCFIDIMLQIRMIPTDDLIAEILCDKDTIEKHPIILGMIRIFDTDGKNESIRDIQTTLQTDTEIFLDSRVQWHFRENANKFSPEVLDEGTSISLEIPDHLGKQFQALNSLYTELVIDCLRSMSEERRNRSGAPMIYLICDEAGSYKIPSLLEALALMRSRRVSMIISVQSLDQIKNPGMYGQTGLNTILDTIETFLVLSCHSVESARIFCEWTGKYSERKISVSSKGLLAPEISLNEGSEKYNIIDISDVLQLRQNREALLFINGKHYIFQKNPYFEIPDYLKLSDSYQTINKARRHTDEREPAI